MASQLLRSRRRAATPVTGAYASAYSVPITTGSFATPQLSLPIPSAGAYLIFVKVWVMNADQSGGNARIDCKLSLPQSGGDLDNSGTTLEPVYGSFATIMLETAWEFPAASSVDLYCLTFNNTPAEAANIKMSALRVDALTHAVLP